MASEPQSSQSQSQEAASSAAVPATTIGSSLGRSFSGAALSALEGLGVSLVDSTEVERAVLARLEAATSNTIDGGTIVPNVASSSSSSSSQSSRPKTARIPRKAKPSTTIAAASGIVSSPPPPPPPQVARRRSTEPHPAPIVPPKNRMRNVVTAAMTASRANASNTANRASIRRKSRSIRDDDDDDDDNDEGKAARDERERQIRHGEITPFAGQGTERGFTRKSRKPTASSSSSSSAAAAASSSSSMVSPAPRARTAASIAAAAASSKFVSVAKPKSKSRRDSASSSSATGKSSSSTKGQKTAAPIPSPAKRARRDITPPTVTSSPSAPPTSNTRSTRRNGRASGANGAGSSAATAISVEPPDGFYQCHLCEHHVADTVAGRAEHSDYHVALSLSSGRSTRTRRGTAAAPPKSDKPNSSGSGTGGSVTTVVKQETKVHDAWLEREEGEIDDMEIADEGSSIPIQLPPRLEPIPSAAMSSVAVAVVSSSSSLSMVKLEKVEGVDDMPKLESEHTTIPPLPLASSLSSSIGDEKRAAADEQSIAATDSPPATTNNNNTINHDNDNGNGKNKKKNKRLRRMKDFDDDYEPTNDDNDNDDDDNDAAAVPLVHDSDDDVDEEKPTASSSSSNGRGRGGSASSSKRQRRSKIDDDHPIRVNTDDADDHVYNDRLERARLRGWLRGPGTRKVPLQPVVYNEDGDEMEQPAATVAARREDDEDPMDVVFDGGLIVPGRIWDKLFPYQRTSIKWMWELHSQNAGGIIADEMGLGKTVQITAFLAALHHSQPAITFGPVLIICPATIMNQWMRELHTWYPEIRVMLLHESGNHNCSNEELVSRVMTSGHVLLTTYQSVRIYKHLLLPREWGYVVLDEGHKIRNPDADISVVCKQLLSSHRLILTGAPIQNRLRELWSLFDFVFPGKLGTLPVFEDEFCGPINAGGYTNASAVAVQMAYKCALVLRDLINPYILRRSKADVATQLPQKTEQVLFCNLAPKQRDAYRAYLKSADVQSAMGNKGSLFKVISVLRKMCNHPDLLLLQGATGKKKTIPTDMPDYGAIERSGKLRVLQSVLRMWREQGHRALVFAQTRQTLDILANFATAEGYDYRRLDGTTSIRNRMPLIDEFNDSNDIFLMLLTTKTGGLGINLVGANRVLLFDPDWNPSTDSQAKERAYRIGQSRDVTVYRLITRGTIEEKVYHRQIFKQFLTNKILKDPKQKRFFNQADMKDLFTLSDEKLTTTETENIFEELDANVALDDDNNDGDTDDDSDNKRKKAKKKSKKTKKKQTKRLRSSDSKKPLLLTNDTAASSASSSSGDTSLTAKNTTGDNGEVVLGAALPPSFGLLNDSNATTPSPRGNGNGSEKKTAKRRRANDASSSSSDSSDSDDSSDSSDSDDSRGRKKKKAPRVRNDDDFVLKLLLQKNGVASAISHDAIMEAKTPETTIVESEAQKIAQKAVAALKASRQQRVQSSSSSSRSLLAITDNSSSSSGSNNGSAPAKKRFGNVTRRPIGDTVVTVAPTPLAANQRAPFEMERMGENTMPHPAHHAVGVTSATEGGQHFDHTVAGFAQTSIPIGSEALLSIQRRRNGDDGGSVTHNAAGLPDPRHVTIGAHALRHGIPEHTQQLLVQLHRYLQQQHRRPVIRESYGGAVPSDAIISHFNSKLRNVADKHTFRQLLRRIATFVPANKAAKRPGGWKLLPDYEHEL